MNAAHRITTLLVPPATLLAAAGATSCGSANDAALYGSGAAGSVPNAPGSTGGAAAAQSGGSVPGQNGGFGAGRAGGAGLASGAGGASGEGSSSLAAGTDAGTRAPSGDGGALDPDGLEAGAAADDGSGSLLECNYTGTWGSFIRVPVTWPATPFVLQAGQGELLQWTLSSRTQNSPTSFHDDSVPCSIFLPDLTGDVLAAYERFGIRFPDSLFDQGGIPTAPFAANVTVTPSGITFDTSPIATLIGHAMANPVTTPWPETGQLSPEDQDFDGNPGVTVVAATGPGYNFPPVSIFPPAGGSDLPRTNFLHIVTRTVATIHGSPVSCDELRGHVEIQQIDGKPAIDSRVIGCSKLDGSPCTADEAAFVDTNRPQFYPSAPGEIVSVRLPDDASCADVRARFPQ